MARSPDPGRTAWCVGCEKHKPRAEFEIVTTRRGAKTPRKQCLVCNGALGHKPCFTCKEDLPMSRYSVVRKKNVPGSLPYPRRDCMKCVYRIQNERRRKRPEDRIKPGPKPGFNRKASRPAGWTPPPTLDQLAAIHRRYSPPPGWTPVPGELGA